MAIYSFGAKFYDGESARPHKVTVNIYGTHLCIRTADKSLEKNWYHQDLVVLESPQAQQPGKVTSRNTPDARLYIQPGKDWDEFRRWAPKTAHPKFSMNLHWHSFLIYAFLSVAVIAVIFTASPKLLEYGAYMIPQSAEDRLGRYTMKNIIHDPVCISPKGVKALERLTRKLQEGMEREIDFKVYVVSNDRTLNAFAAPGGHLAVFAPVIEKAGSADEVAGVLAHEMAHIELRHPTKSLSRDLGFSMLTLLMFGDAGSIGSMAEAARLFNQMQYSRKEELEADSAARDFLIAADINPAALAAFFEKLKKEETKRWEIFLEEEGEEKEAKDEEAEQTKEKWSKLLQVFSTHPETQERIEKIRAEEGGRKKYKKALSQKEWRALKNICKETKDFEQGA